MVDVPIPAIGGHSVNTSAEALCAPKVITGHQFQTIDEITTECQAQLQHQTMKPDSTETI